MLPIRSVSYLSPMCCNFLRNMHKLQGRILGGGALGARAPRSDQRGAKRKEKRKGKERERGEKREKKEKKGKREKKGKKEGARKKKEKRKERKKVKSI